MVCSATAPPHKSKSGNFFLDKTHAPSHPFLFAKEKEVPKSSDGQLSLRVIRAMDLMETGVIKYQDPFVVMETTRARFETAVAKGAGSDPEWKEAFDFQVAEGNAAAHTMMSRLHEITRVSCVCLCLHVSLGSKMCST